MVIRVFLLAVIQYLNMKFKVPEIFRNFRTQIEQKVENGEILCKTNFIFKSLVVFGGWPKVGFFWVDGEAKIGFMRVGGNKIRCIVNHWIWAIYGQKFSNNGFVKKIKMRIVSKNQSFDFVLIVDKKRGRLICGFYWFPV